MQRRTATSVVCPQFPSTITSSLTPLGIKGPPVKPFAMALGPSPFQVPLPQPHYSSAGALPGQPGPSLQWQRSPVVWLLCGCGVLDLTPNPEVLAFKLRALHILAKCLEPHSQHCTNSLLGSIASPCSVRLPIYKSGLS